ncbi:MAG: hypothetical protein J7K46_06900 [Bacteroidales bacterium]|nr:hypothetical protein [Bacteroidales bacterium]
MIKIKIKQATCSYDVPVLDVGLLKIAYHTLTVRPGHQPVRQKVYDLFD